MKRSLVVGSGGQDGYYLGELLRARGDEVVGVTRGALDIFAREPVAHLVGELKPDEVYYLAAWHGAAEADHEDPYANFRNCQAVHVEGWHNFLDAAQRRAPAARLFYAASSHVFGDASASPQDETTPFLPVNAYGVTKAAGIGLARMYRRSGLFASCGILYNHESPRRAPNYVSRKIVRGAVEIKLGARRELRLGNLAAAVDWGAAQDYVDAMARILRLDAPGDFVVATGVLRTVREFAQAAFGALGLSWDRHVVEDRGLIPPTRPSRPLVGDATRLREASGWRPLIDFDTMVKRMVAAELSARSEARADAR